MRLAVRTRCGTVDTVARQIWRAGLVVIVVGLGSVALACRTPQNKSAPVFRFTRVPMAGEGGPDRTGTIEGRVVDAQPGQRIVLFAHWGPWWVQPRLDQPFTSVESDSRWRNTTDLGTQYAAILVERNYQPPANTDSLPPTGSGLVAVAVVNGTPVFWQTWWFLSAAALTLAVIAAAYVRCRMRRSTEEEERFREAIDTIPAITFTTGSDGSNVFVNQRWIEYAGLSAEQTSGVGWQRAIHPDDLAGHFEKWRVTVANGQPFEDEARFRRASDGEYRWFLVRGIPLRDPRGKIVKWYGTLTDIEDRKRVEQSLQSLSIDLQDSQARLAEAQRITHVGYWVWDFASNSLTWSDETYRIFGMQPQERSIDVPTFQSMIHPEDREFLLRATDEAQRGEARPGSEFRIVRPSGEIRTLLSQGDMKRDASGKLHERFGTVQDITERKRAEEALRRTQFYLNEAQRLAHMGTWAFDAAGFDFWSSELFHIYGLDPEGKPPTTKEYLEFVHPEDRDFVEHEIKKMLSEHGQFDFTKRIVRPDGKVRYIRCVGVPITEGGFFKGFVGTGIDVTDQELLTQELERDQAYLSEAQKLTHTGSWVWNISDRNPVHLSDEWYRIYGFDPADGAPPWEKRLQRVHPDDRLFWKSTLEKAIVDKSDYDLVFRILLPEGVVRWIHTVGHPVLTSAGELVQFLGNSTDITERKLAEQEREKLRQLEDDLAHINRVSMLGEMAASLAHEIKQPIAAAITSANSCVEWLAHEPPNLDRARAAANKVDKYGNRAAEIIERIRSLYKKSPPQRELVDVNQIIVEMLTLLKGEADRCSVSIRTDLAAGLPRIRAELVQLQQVFMNLMLNAIEAMQQAGGELTVTSQVRDSQLLLSVGDTGVGLPIERGDRIFSAFFTTKPQGSGMGLAISRSIVESHGGRLWATANEGSGATFHFILPTESG